MSESLVELPPLGGKESILRNSRLPDDLRSTIQSHPVYWVGCVRIQDLERAARFLALSHAGRVDELTAFYDIGEELLSAVLIGSDSPNEWQLAIFTSIGWSRNTWILGPMIRGIQVREKITPAVDLKALTRITFVDVLRALFR